MTCRGCRVLCVVEAPKKAPNDPTTKKCIPPLSTGFKYLFCQPRLLRSTTYYCTVPLIPLYFMLSNSRSNTARYNYNLNRYCSSLAYFDPAKKPKNASTLYPSSCLHASRPHSAACAPCLSLRRRSGFSALTQAPPCPYIQRPRGRPRSMHAL